MQIADAWSTELIAIHCFLFSVFSKVFGGDCQEPLACGDQDSLSIPTLKNGGEADFPGGPVVKNPPANAGDTGSNPGLGRFHIPQGNQAHVPQLRSPSRVARAPQQGKSSQWESPALR